MVERSYRFLFFSKCVRVSGCVRERDRYFIPMKAFRFLYVGVGVYINMYVYVYVSTRERQRVYVCVRMCRSRFGVRERERLSFLLCRLKVAII